MVDAGDAARIATPMPDTPGINYGHYMERAMRGVMADVLGHVAKHGLLGEHHFYISFDTAHPGVDIPAYLRERYPGEMMIVLQDWYEDLAVTGDRFRVTLNFANTPETLVIPLEAVKTFVDPSAKFGLKFDDQGSDDDGEGSAAFEPADAIGGRADPDPEADLSPEDDPGGSDPSGPGDGAQTADVVRLDRFRKS